MSMTRDGMVALEPTARGIPDSDTGRGCIEPYRSLAHLDTEERCATERAHLGHLRGRPANGLGGGVALAQELDAKWLVGTWQALTPSSAGMGQADRVEVTVKPDGTFEGDAQSASVGLLNFRSGTWKVSGEAVVLDATIQGGRRINGSSVKWTLKRNGEDLEGTGHREFDNKTNPVTFKKAR